MKTLKNILQIRVIEGDSDARLMQFARTICFILAGFIFVAGLLRVCQFQLTPAELFNSVLQVVQTSVLVCILGFLLHRKSDAA